MTALRRNLDICLERLPTLLNLDVAKSVSREILLPTVLSQLRALSLASETNSMVSSREENLPATMSYALQQARIYSQKTFLYLNVTQLFSVLVLHNKYSLNRISFLVSELLP